MEDLKLRIGYEKSLVAALLVVIFSVSGCGVGVGTLADEVDPDPPPQLGGDVVVYGDSRSGHSMHQLIMGGIAAIDPVAVFHTGDLVNDGRVAGDWVTFNNIASQLATGTPIYPALGNHEYESSLYFDNFTLPGNERWYLIDNIDGFNFIVLDTESNISQGSAQYQWLESELSASVSSTDFTIVTFHYPIYSTGEHGSDVRQIGDILEPIFEQYGVDAVFNGHDHNYERSTVNGIRYIVTGGGGAPLRDQAGSSPYSELFVKAYHFCVLYFDAAENLMVDVYNDSVQLIDRFEIVNR